MTSDRRSFLKHAAATLAVTAVAGCAPDGTARAGRALDEQLLASLGDAILPETIGGDGRARAVAAFREWIAAYEPVSEEMHGYGDAEITFTPADPAPGWNAQLAALDLLARKKHGAGFAALAADKRRALVKTQLAQVRGGTLPANPLTAPHVAVAVLAHWAASSDAADLAWGAHIGKGNCRTLAESPRKPLPLAGGGKS